MFGSTLSSWFMEEINAETGSTLFVDDPSSSTCERRESELRTDTGRLLRSPSREFDLVWYALDMVGQRGWVMDE